MKTLRYGLLIVAQLGLASMCLADEATSAEETTNTCWAATKTAGQSCYNGAKGLVVTVDGDTACLANTKDAAGICYNQGLEMYEQKNTQLRDKIVGWVEASPLKAEAKTWLIGQFTDAPRTSVAVTTGAALLAVALTVYGIARGLKALVSTKATAE